MASVFPPLSSSSSIRTSNSCSCPPPSENKKPCIDVRYLENDSRYITPEDKARYMKEYEDNKKKKELYKGI